MGASARRVLVVDDHDDCRILVMEVLRIHGYDVEAAHNGEMALERLLRERFDVALLDIGMPLMSGIEVARRLRTHLGASTPRLIAVTGFGRSVDRDEAERAGFDDYLVKPVDPERLVASVEPPAP